MTWRRSGLSARAVTPPPASRAFIVVLNRSVVVEVCSRVVLSDETSVRVDTVEVRVVLDKSVSVVERIIWV